MASQSYSRLVLSLPQELQSNEIIKIRAYLMNPKGRKHEIAPENFFNLKVQHLELVPWKPLRKSYHFVEFDSTMMKPRLLYVHETGQEEVIEFLWSRADKLKERGFDMSCSSLLSSSQEPVKPLLVDPMRHDPEFSDDSDAHMFLSSRRVELNDVVSVAAEFHMSKNSARWRKLSRLLPQFQRFDNEVLIDTLQPNTVDLDADTRVPLKSPRKTRVKPSPKKENPKMRDREKDL